MSEMLLKSTVSTLVNLLLYQNSDAIYEQATPTFLDGCILC